MTFKRRSSQAFPSRVDTILKSAGQHRLAPKPPPFAASVWLDAVGPLIANRSEPLSLQRGELLVRVNSSVWASELSMHSSVVIARLVERRIEVSRLRFRVAPPAFARRPGLPTIPRPVPERVQLDRSVMQSLARVTDDGLRETLTDAAAMNLGWQRLQGK